MKVQLPARPVVCATARSGQQKMDLRVKGPEIEALGQVRLGQDQVIPVEGAHSLLPMVLGAAVGRCVRPLPREQRIRGQDNKEEKHDDCHAWAPESAKR